MDRTWFKNNQTFCAIAGFALLAITLGVIGCLAPPFLGDEIHHYRFAKDCVLIHGRALYDSAYGTGMAPGFFYATDPAWPLGLSFVWKLAGVVSHPIAQFYHAFFYFLLMVSTYGFAKELYGPRPALWTALLTASTPMVVSFSVLFFIDVPSVALTMCAFWLMQKNKSVAAGLMFGIAVLTKKTAIFFLPFLVLSALLNDTRKLSHKIGLIFILMTPTLGLYVWDASWRTQHLVRTSEALRASEALRLSEALRTSEEIWTLFRNVYGRFQAKFNPITEYAVSSISNVKDVLKYFGAILIFSVAGYLIAPVKEAKDKLIVFAAAGYVVGVVSIRLLPDIRYILPVTPFLALLAGKFLTSLKQNWMKAGVIGICLLQLGAAAGYTVQQRMIPSHLMEAFRYIQHEVPKDALILYPETNMIEYAGHRMIWSLCPLQALFWGSMPEKQSVISSRHMTHIAIKKSRTFNDRAMKNPHMGGYPVSFLEQLPALADKVFENSELSLWKTHVLEMQKIIEPS